MIAPIRVVVADDSLFICNLLTAYLQSSPDFQVVGTALNGIQAIELARELRPDVITLDLEMPGLNGLEALECIMNKNPTPVIVVSGVSRRAAAITLRALDLGAVDFVLKYTPGVDTNPEVLRQEIMAKVRAASQTRALRPLALSSNFSTTPRLHIERGKTSSLQSTIPNVVVIGASTGGIMALSELLSSLSTDFPASIIIVQHIPASFTEVLVVQLNRQAPFYVKEAEAGDRLESGLVLIVPGDYHLLLRPDAQVELNQGPPIGGYRPSIDVTMQSVAQVCGASTKGVVLTGMGSDGSMGLVAIRAKGGETFAQDAASCVVNGMPQRAIEKGVVDYVAPPATIAKILTLRAVGRETGGLATPKFSLPNSFVAKCGPTVGLQ